MSSTREASSQKAFSSFLVKGQSQAAMHCQECQGLHSNHTLSSS
jgi:hypothetical protein